MRNYNSYSLSLREKICWGGAALVGTLALCYLFFDNVLLSCIGGALSIKPAWKIYEKHRIKAAKELLRTQFIDLLYSLSASIATGRQMSEALREAGGVIQSMYPKTSPLALELDYMEKAMGETNTCEEELISDLAARSDIEDIKNFAAVYSACRETGADTEDVIRKTCNVINDKIQIEKELRTLTAQKKMESKIITAIPILIILFLRLSSPEYIEPLYQGLVGRLIMACALITMLGAYKLTEKISDIRV